MNNLLSKLVEQSTSVEKKEIETSTVKVKSFRDAIKKDGTHLENMSFVTVILSDGNTLDLLSFNNNLKGFPKNITQPFDAELSIGMGKDKENNDVIRVYEIKAMIDVSFRDKAMLLKELQINVTIAG